MVHRLFILLWMLGWSALATAQKAAARHSQVELLAQPAAIMPGTEVQLGVHFVLDPGWHIYWVNPGDSGQPPSLKWQLPPGYTAGEIQWPHPERMQPTPQLADYGYHGDVLLPVTLHVPSSATAGASVQVTAEAKWLVCREVCIPEKAQLQLTLPVAMQVKENQQAASLFVRAAKLLPKPMPRAWKTTVKPEKDDFILTLQTGKKISKADFFPLDSDQIDNPAPQKLQTLPTGARITLKKSDLLLKPIQTLRGVLVLPSDVAYRIEAPVR
ncbi:MAG TPA: protein-disulfide reductase DsbD domain-containing protein [Candidatus Sulfotelmatobacter sp.]|nr:protein-disulfide reductase DsbD domain-containing protein [Candidatus Sulfotelmatobacter sp.]